MRVEFSPIFWIAILATSFLLSFASAEQPCECSDTAPMVRPIFSGVAENCEIHTRAVKSTEEVSVQIPTDLSGRFVLPVTKGGVEHEFEMASYSVRGENFRVVATGAGGELEQIQVAGSCTYRGAMVGDTDTTIIGAITERGASMRVFCSDGECWDIRREAGEYHLETVSVKRQLAEMLYAVESGMVTEAVFGALALPREVTVKRAEIGFDIDYPTWSRSNSGGFNRDDSAAVAKMEEFVAVKLNSFIISNALVEHVIGTVVIRKSQADDPYDGMTDASSILSRMRSVWNGGTSFPRPSTTHDLATGLIGRGIGVNGLGYVGTINETSRYNISTTTGGSGVGFWFNGIAKHECGHNWGLGHGGCGDEKRPITNPDDFTWSMCGGWHDRMRTDEAARVISERDSSNLQDIGAYTASSQAPYCPKDTATVSIGGDGVLLDVQRNDYDANNDRFQLENVKLNDGTGVSASVGQTATTELGGTMQISVGSGSGGRDEVLYTPPATGTPGSVDRFWYTVKDETGRGNFGQVKVTLQPSTQPKPVNPASYIADTAIDFSNEQNPTQRLIGIDGNGDDILGDVWSYGSFNGGSPTLSLALGSQTDSAAVVGQENEGWIGSGAVRVHKQAMLPSDDNDAVKRWTSSYSGEVAVVYDIRRVDTGGNGSLVSLQHNGQITWSATVNDASPHVSGTVSLAVSEGDTVDFVIDSLGSRSGDWTFFTARIIPAEQVKWEAGSDLQLHYRFDAAGTYPIERRRFVADYSGNNNHAPLTGFDVNQSRTPAEIENGILFDGDDDEIRTGAVPELNGATGLTMSVWVKPNALTDNAGIITTNVGTYFGLLVAAASDGQGVQFRANNMKIVGEANAIPLDKWTHVLGTWKSDGTARIYINGKMDIEVGNAAGTPVNTDIWVIGHDRAQTQGSRFFDGTIDDTGLWSRALDASEVAAIYEQGRYSRSYDGVDDFQQSSSPLYAQGSTEVTIAAWVRAGSLGDNRGVITSYNSDDINRSYFGLIIGNAEAGRPAQFRAHRELLNALPGSFPVGEWAHIAGVWRDGVEQSLYIDGTLVASEPISARGPIDIESWITGRDRLIDGNPSRFFDGDIGDRVILSRALDAGEIGELYAAGRTNFSASEGAFESGGQIGSQSGTYEEASGIFTTSTRGSQIGGTSDSFVFASRGHKGDGRLAVRLEALLDDGVNATSGVMFRASRAVNAPFVYISQSSSGQVTMTYRPTAGGSAVTRDSVTQAATFPLWLRLVRSGDQFVGEYSDDGENWDALASVELDLPEDLELGIAHEANSTSRRSIASFGDLRIDSQRIYFNVDEDDDGMHDFWELTYFGDLSEGADGDPDADGISNLFEYFYATNPVAPEGEQLQVSFASHGQQLVPFGSTWSYLADGSNQGSAWRSAAFDDSAWLTGLAPLGYGEDGLGQEIGYGGDDDAKFITSYFRHRFDVMSPATVFAPVLRVIRDDGIAIYLNGVEVGRDNLPSGAGFATEADVAIGGDDETTPITFPISASDFVIGENTLAVELHQVGPTSSDVRFDLELATGIPTGLVQGDYLTAAFERSEEASFTLNTIAEGSSDLVNWTALSTPVIIVQRNIGTQTVLITDDQPFDSNNRRYLRLRLTSKK